MTNSFLSWGVIFILNICYFINSEDTFNFVIAFGKQEFYPIVIPPSFLNTIVVEFILFVWIKISYFSSRSFSNKIFFGSSSRALLWEKFFGEGGGDGELASKSSSEEEEEPNYSFFNRMIYLFLAIFIWIYYWWIFLNDTSSDTCSYPESALAAFPESTLW